jgi:hypothetical protein
MLAESLPQAAGTRYGVSARARPSSEQWALAYTWLLDHLAVATAALQLGICEGAPS